MREGILRVNEPVSIFHSIARQSNEYKTRGQTHEEREERVRTDHVRTEENSPLREGVRIPIGEGTPTREGREVRNDQRLRRTGTTGEDEA